MKKAQKDFHNNCFNLLIDIDVFFNSYTIHLPKVDFKMVAREGLKNLVLIVLILSPIFAYGIGILQYPSNQTVLNPKNPIPTGEGMDFEASEQISSFDGKVSGIGSSANVSLSCNDSGVQGELITNGTLEISVPDPWSIHYTNLTVTDVVKNNTILS